MQVVLELNSKQEVLAFLGRSNIPEWECRVRSLRFSALAAAEVRTLCAKVKFRFGWLSKLGSLFLGTLNNWCYIIIGTQKGTIILTTTHLEVAV